MLVLNTQKGWMCWPALQQQRQMGLTSCAFFWQEGIRVGLLLSW